MKYDLPRGGGPSAGGDTLLSLVYIGPTAEQADGPNQKSKNKNQSGVKNKIMRSGEYTSRRGSTSYLNQSSSWTRNRNTIRHQNKNLGPISLVGMFLMLITVMGMIYLTQGTKATSYDYALDQLDTEIAELTAEKEDLAVEKARLTSIASAETSTVAVSMSSASPSAYVSE